MNSRISKLSNHVILQTVQIRSLPSHDDRRKLEKPDPVEKCDIPYYTIGSCLEAAVTFPSFLTPLELLIR